MSSTSDWIIKLWPIVCARARRPVAGIILGTDAAGEVAESVFEQFLESFPKEPGSWETVQHWLTSRVAPEALSKVAAWRRGSKDWQAARDPLRCFWELNPDFDALRARDADGALTSRSWSLVEPILWRRSGPLLRRIGVSEDDARDVFMETLAELTVARPDPGPLEKMQVFEELPRFFDMMVERRGISWLRRISARKRAPVHPQFTERLDEPDNSWPAPWQIPLPCPPWPVSPG